MSRKPKLSRQEGKVVIFGWLMLPEPSKAYAHEAPLPDAHRFSS